MVLSYPKSPTRSLACKISGSLAFHQKSRLGGAVRKKSLEFETRRKDISYEILSERPDSAAVGESTFKRFSCFIK